MQFISNVKADQPPDIQYVCSMNSKAKFLLIQLLIVKKAALHVCFFCTSDEPYIFVQDHLVTVDMYEQVKTEACRALRLGVF